MVKFLNTELNRSQLAQYNKIFRMIKEVKPIHEINDEWKNFVQELVGSLQKIPPASIDIQVDALDEYIQEWEDQLRALGDEAQLANVNMQDALQRQQQSLLMISNISKLLHDTATDVIRNMDG
jgi:hypothetical protein